tara:strand:+ start:140 stop:370 length:231 start_codon:yes stop_codon:yes gene_type:complete
LTTPQEQAAAPPQEPNEAAPQFDPENQGFIFKVITRLMGWGAFLGIGTLTIGLVVFVALALYRGIQWLWPVAGVAQ